MTEFEQACVELMEAEDRYNEHVDRYGFDEFARGLQEEIEDLEYRVEYLEETSN